MKSDSEIRSDVECELEWDPSIDSRNVAVAVENGVVTLTGYVPAWSDKWQAEDIAKRVSGVTAIANDIEVKLATERTDTDIAEAAENALGMDNRLPINGVKVVVSNGWITLGGKVTYHYQRSAAEDDVRYLNGVRGVTNAIALVPNLIPSEIKAKIEQAFERNGQLDADRISVESLGGRIILSGTVSSWLERHEAENAAWRAPGVIEVDNKIEVEG